MYEKIHSEVEKQLQNRIEETRAEITSEVKKYLCETIASTVGEQLQKGTEENRAEIMCELERGETSVLLTKTLIKN